MAQGGEYHNLATEYRIGTSTVHNIVHEVLPLNLHSGGAGDHFPDQHRLTEDNCSWI